jgi:hypothetical protein
MCTQGTYITGFVSGIGQTGTYLVNSNAQTAVYSTGTLAAVSGGATTITGQGTQWTPALIGGTISIASGETKTITDVTSPTSITVAALTNAISANATYAITYPIGATQNSGYAFVGPIYGSTVAINQPIFVSGTYDSGNADGWWIVDLIQPSTSGQIINLGAITISGVASYTNAALQQQVLGGMFLNGSQQIAPITSWSAANGGGQIGLLKTSLPLLRLHHLYPII